MSALPAFSLRETALLWREMHRYSPLLARRGGWLALFAALADVAGMVALVPLVTLVIGGVPGRAIRRGFALLEPLGVTTELTRLAVAFLVFLLIIGLRTGLVLLRDANNLKIQAGFIAHLQVQLMDRLARAPWERVEALQHARITQALSAEVGRAGTCAQLVLQIFGAGLILVLQWLLALVIAPGIALAVLVIAALAGATFARSLIRTGTIGAEMNQRGLSMTHIAQQFLGGLKLAKAQNAEIRFTAEFAAASRAMLATLRGFLLRQLKTRQALTFAAALAAGLFLLVGKASGMDAARLLAAFAILTRISSAGTSLIQLLQQFAAALPSHTTLIALTTELAAPVG